MDPRNPHNSYYYKPLDQAAPIYVPPSSSTRRIQPVPQKTGQTEYHYGMPGQATPIYVPPSKGADARVRENQKREPKNLSARDRAIYEHRRIPGSPGDPEMEDPKMDDEKKGSGGGGMMSGLIGKFIGGGGMAALSDERSKKEIQRLESTNDALMKALDTSAANTGGNMPETEYPQLPAHTRFADAPAEKVAAQNVGMQAAQQPPMAPQAAPQAPPQGMQPNPQQQNFARSANPAFNVNRGMPDMSALDEAYRRQGMGG
jgi:hypothetical protein